MSVFDDFETILDYAHFWNWAPDWNVVKDIYSRIPESYSVLTPFAYSYLEELIRSTTSEYGIPFLDRNGKKNNFKVGMGLIKLAKEENTDKPEYIASLDKMKKYFMTTLFMLVVFFVLVTVKVRYTEKSMGYMEC